MAYAEKTTISISRTKADIEDLIQKAGAEQFISGYKDNMSIIGFTPVSYTHLFKSSYYYNQYQYTY